MSRDIVRTFAVEVGCVDRSAGGYRGEGRGRSRGEVVRTYGISRRWVHELVKRFEVEGEAGLQPRSRRPWTSPQQVSQVVEDEIVALRKTLSDQGLDAGAVTIAAHLTIRHGATPAPSTIWRVLSRLIGFQRGVMVASRFQLGLPA